MIAGKVRATDPQTCEPSSFATWSAGQPVQSLYGFDGYHWLREGVVVASGQTFTPPLSYVGSTITCTETVTYPFPLLTSDTVSSASEKVVAPVPIISHVRLSSSVWSEGKRSYRAVKGRHRPPVGTVIRFDLNERVPLTFKFTQRLPGRRVEGECEPVSRYNARHRACTRTVTVASIYPIGQLESNEDYFQGLIDRKHNKSLKPGRYTLVIGAANTTGTGKPVSVSFTVLE